MSDYAWVNLPGGLKRLSYKQRKVHVDGEGRLRERNFFRNLPTKGNKMCGYTHENMGVNQIRTVFEYRVDRDWKIPRIFSSSALESEIGYCTPLKSRYHGNDRGLAQVSPPCIGTRSSVWPLGRS